MTDKKVSTPAKQAEAKPAPKKKHTVRTTAQRIEKAEADLKALRDKAEEKNRKQVQDLKAKRAKLIDKSEELNSKIDEISDQITELGGDSTPPPSADSESTPEDQPQG